LVSSFEGLGKNDLQYLGIYLAMQFIDVAIFVACYQAMPQLIGNEGVNIVPTLSSLIIFLTNVMLTLYAGIKAAFTMTENSKTISFTLGAATGQLTNAIGALAKR
jgi:hypothetical protein